MQVYPKYDCIVYSPFKYYESKGIKDLGFTRVHGETRYNKAKNAEIKDRVSMWKGKVKWYYKLS